jgi:outer membrane protein assembly factor BamB
LTPGNFRGEFARMIPALLRVIIASLFTVVFISMSQASDWPQWRGPNRNGHVPAGVPVPDRFPSEPRIVWRMKVGEGLASPVVAGGKLFYFDAVLGKETLHTLDLATTNEVWRATIDSAFKDNQGPAGPRCTPVVDGARVYALSCKGELQCLSITDGKLIWQVNCTNDLGAIFIGEIGSIPGAARHGNNGTPLIIGDRLYACVGATNGAGVVCFDKNSGKVLWKSQNDQAAYAPPVIETLAGVRQLICFTVDGLIGLNPENGELHWRVPMKTAFARHVTTPVIVEDIVIVASHQIGMVGTRISKEGAGLKSEQAWLSKEVAMNFASPVVVGKYLYGLGPAKNFICVEAATGKKMWSKEGYFTTSADKAHAAFLVMGKNILASTDGGELVLFAADPAGFREISRAQVCSLNWCNPAYADGKLFLRDGTKTTGELLCVELMLPSEP